MNFWSFIPKLLLSDKQWKAFFEKLKEYYDNYIFFVDELLDMVSVDSKYFVYLGKQFGCHYDLSMTDSEMRQSIYESIKINKQPLSFEYWKLVIDKITNGDSVIYKGAVLQEPVFYGTAIYGFDEYPTVFEIPKDDYDNASRIGVALIGVGIYGVSSIDKGYGDASVIYGNSVYGGDTFVYVDEVIGTSRLPNIYIDLQIPKVEMTNELLSKIEKRLSILKNSFFVINIGIVEEIYFRTYVRLR